MANVVIVTKHLFMNENGVDYALGMSASDILPFSNMEKAVDYVEEQIKVAYADEPNFDRYDWSKEECMYQGVSQMVSFSQYSYNNRGIRTAFRIVKRKID
jgi:hypothetical protein